ncbi:MAG: NAD-dependent protein deacylase [Bacteroidota bacterium]
MEEHKLKETAELILNSSHNTGFTGAGVSVESGIPPFRGENGLWNKYDPGILDLNYFYSHPEKAWPVIKEIFYEFFGNARPNEAHKALAELEKMGMLHGLITQNIDNLHQEAGSKTVYEFHGNSRYLVCQRCHERYQVNDEFLAELPPKCKKCGALLKPDFIFFGEMIPQYAYQKSMEEARQAEVFIVIGTTGEVVPASLIPKMASENGVKIIEVNPNTSCFTHSITDIFLEGKAAEVMTALLQEIKNMQ